MSEERVPKKPFSGTYRMNVYPKSRFRVHIVGTCTRKGTFGYISSECHIRFPDQTSKRLSCLLTVTALRLTDSERQLH